MVGDDRALQLVDRRVERPQLREQKLRVPNRMLDVGMAQPRLDGSRVMPSVRQRIPAAVAQHVRMDRERQARTELRNDPLRVLDDGQPAGLKLPPCGTVGVLRDAFPDPLEVGFQFGLGDGLLGHVALPASAALVAGAVDGVARGGW
jgi:hypothetical protein